MSPFHGTIAIFPPSLCSCSSEECQNCVRIACVCTSIPGTSQYSLVNPGIHDSKDAVASRCCSISYVRYG